MHRQCLFQRRMPSTPRCVAAPSTRAFSSTPVRPRRKENRLVDVRMQMAGAENTVRGQPAPNLQTSKREVQEMAEDIGLLQNTVIRASFSKLPAPTSWEFYSYFWTVLKSRFTGLYTRSHFKRCVHKSGVKSYLPVDFLQQSMLKNKAKRFYKRYYELLAAYVHELPSPRPSVPLRRTRE
jgi:protein MBA1